MAIVNTFRKCLESPYLAVDPEAPARVPALLALADDRLGAAETLTGSSAADKSDATFLAYEAQFACVRALVYSRGYREAGLRCLILACEELFVRSGQLDPAHLIAMERTQGFKLDPAAAVEAARAFRLRAGTLLTETVTVSTVISPP
jgi:uncharacterized protein (UPF0332 family)